MSMAKHHLSFPKNAPVMALWVFQDEGYDTPPPRAHQQCFFFIFIFFFVFYGVPRLFCSVYPPSHGAQHTAFPGGYLYTAVPSPLPNLGSLPHPPPATLPLVLGVTETLCALLS